MRKTAVRTSSLHQTKLILTVLEKARRSPRRAFFFCTLGALVLGGCSSIWATRPVQEMSDTAAAIRAAKEVQADALAADLFRQADEEWILARREYRQKNFMEAKEALDRARKLAEQAEFEALRAGGSRTDLPPDPLSASPNP